MTPPPDSESDRGQRVRTSARFDLVSACLGGLLLGSWAWALNWVGRRNGDLDGAPPWVSGLTQFIGSFLVTLAMVRAASWLYHRTAHLRFGCDLLLPVLTIVLVTGSCLAAAHAVVGTPEILKTIAPGLGVAFTFNLFTVVKLRRLKESGIS